MSLNDSPLGHATAYIDRYDPTLLFPIARAANRAQLSSGRRPTLGVDIWTAYELSWLDLRGKPHVAMATFVFPADTPNIIESKSFKLYLNSFNQTPFANHEAVRAAMVCDLSDAAGAAIDVTLHRPEATVALPLADLPGTLIDGQDIDVAIFTPDASLLHTLPRTGADVPEVTETLVSRLLKSNCPVTGQPDWASLQVTYTGAQIDPAALLRYVVSFRQHADFHEHCVERMFDDIMQRCAPRELTVYARYTRRGGLDINPWRSTETRFPPANQRTPRQ